MNTVKLSNISLEIFRTFLFEQGCTREEKGTKGRGGHEKWVRDNLLRPIILQTHIDPVPEIVVKSNLRTLGLTSKDLKDWILKHKQ